MECYLHSIIFSVFPRKMSIVSGSSGRVLKAYDLVRFYEIARMYNGIADIYTELYSGSVIDKVVFDIDAERLSDAFIDFVGLARVLDKDSVPYVAVFSGRKGFHIYVLTKRIEIRDEKTMRLVVKSVQDYYAQEAGLRHLDKHLIGATRHWIRVPNTIHTGSGKYSFFVELGTEKLSEIYSSMNMPSCPKTYQHILRREPIDPREYVGVTSSYNEPRMGPPRLPSQTYTGSSVARFLSNLVRPCILDMVLQPDPDHFSRTQFALELCWLGFDPEDIVGIISRLGWEDYNERITRYHVGKICEKAWSGSLKPASCRTLRDRGYCIGEKCPYYPGYFYWWGMF